MAGIDPELFAAHQQWLRTVGAEGARLEIDGLVQPGARLAEVNLSGAVLVRANLRGADLRGVDFSHVALHEADLSGADLSGADLYKAELPQARLHGARLHAARLIRADLTGADLSDADLSRTYLLRADLDGADLRGTSLAEADLDRTIVDGSTWGRTTVTGALGTVALFSVTLMDGHDARALDATELVEYLAGGGARVTAVVPQQVPPQAPIPWRWGS